MSVGRISDKCMSGCCNRWLIFVSFCLCLLLMMKMMESWECPVHRYCLLLEKHFGLWLSLFIPLFETIGCSAAVEHSNFNFKPNTYVFLMFWIFFFAVSFWSSCEIWDVVDAWCEMRQFKRQKSQPLDNSTNNQTPTYYSIEILERITRQRLEWSSSFRGWWYLLRCSFLLQGFSRAWILLEE